MSTHAEKVWYNVYIMIHRKFKNCTHSLMGKASERCRFLQGEQYISGGYTFMKEKL